MGLFKKPQPETQKSESGNYAYNDISTAFKPALGYVTQSGNAMADLLGVGSGGTGAQTAALDNFANSGGMDFLMKNMQKAVTSSKAAQGLGLSGSFGTALQDRAFGLGSTYLKDYMASLLGLGNLGVSSGAVLTDAGRWSKGQGTGATQGGLGKQLLPMIASAGLTAAASDPRLKTNVQLVEHDSDNIPVYEFNYRKDTPLTLPEGKFRGYMADTLLVAKPEVVTTKDGYLHVTDPKYFPKKVN